MRAAVAIPACLAAGLALGLAGGCSAAPETEPGTCPEARTVQVVDHGRHAGLVVAREDLVAAVPALAGSLPAGDQVEIGWGDARYYPSPDPGIGLALRAALWPTASVLHVAVLPQPPARYFAGAEVLAVDLGESGHRALLDFIADTFERDAAGGVQRVGPALYGQGGFYAATGRFHLFNTCNTWIARGLERAGVPVSAGGVVTADDLLSRLRETACVAAGRELNPDSRERPADAARPGSRAAPGSGSPPGTRARAPRPGFP